MTPPFCAARRLRRNPISSRVVQNLRSWKRSLHDPIIFLRIEMTSDSGKLRTEMVGELGKMRTEMAQGFGQLRAEMAEGFGRLRGDMLDRNAELLKWGLVFGMTQTAAVAGIVALLC